MRCSRRARPSARRRSSAGQSDAEAHEAAKAHWNAWADDLLAGRKAMEASGAWKSELGAPWERERGQNPETRAWLEKAATDFSRCLFLLQGVEGTKETAGEDKVSTPENAAACQINKA